MLINKCNVNNLKDIKIKKGLLALLIIIFVSFILFLIPLITLIVLNVHNINSNSNELLNASINLYAVSGSEQTTDPNSGLNTINFNLDLFLFVIMIIFLAIMVIGAIVVLTLIFYLYHRRKKPIVVEYDQIKVVDSNDLLDTNNISEGIINIETNANRTEGQ